MNDRVRLFFCRLGVVVVSSSVVAMILYGVFIAFPPGHSLIEEHVRWCEQVEQRLDRIEKKLGIEDGGSR